MKNPTLYFLLLILTVFGTVCTNNDAQNKFEALAYALPSNYTETDFQGNTVREDSDDWRISPFYLGLVDVEPIFPNPIGYGNNATLDVNVNGVSFSSIMEVGYLTEANNFIDLQILDVASDFEILSFTINTNQFGTATAARGIHRLLLIDGNQRIISYGDLLIE